MTPPGIEPATFRFVAQHLKHYATSVPKRIKYSDTSANEDNSFRDHIP